MSLYEIISIVNLAIIGMAVAVFAWLLFTGELGERRLHLSPTRDLNEPIAIYVIGILGVLLYGGLKLALGNTQEVTVQLAIELISYLMIGLMVSRARLADAGFRKIGILPRWPKRDVCWGVVGGFVSLGLAAVVGLLIQFISTQIGHKLDPIAHEALKTLREEFSIEILIALTISAVIMAPLIEELLFRGVFQTSLMRLMRGRRWPALLIASAVFAVIHWWVVPWHSLIILFVLGLVFGYLYERTGSLLPPILAHAVFNAANITIALSLPEQPPVAIM